MNKQNLAVWFLLIIFMPVNSVLAKNRDVSITQVHVIETGGNPVGIEILGNNLCREDRYGTLLSTLQLGGMSDAVSNLNCDIDGTITADLEIELITGSYLLVVDASKNKWKSNKSGKRSKFSSRRIDRFVFTYNNTGGQGTGGISSIWVDISASTTPFDRNCEYRWKTSLAAVDNGTFYASIVSPLVVKDDAINTATHISASNKTEGYAPALGTFSVTTEERCEGNNGAGESNY